MIIVVKNIFDVFYKNNKNAKLFFIFLTFLIK